MFNLSLIEAAGLSVTSGLRPFVPTGLDYSICDRRYGLHLTPLLCDRAAETLAEGDSLFPYSVSGSAGGPQALPQTAEFGE